MLTVRNNPSARHWNVEDGYRSNVDENELYPNRLSETGRFNSLGFRLLMTVDNSFHLCNHLVGFIISFHMPNELWQMSKNQIFIPPGIDTKISIIPKVTITSDGLRKYAPQVRGCYFQTDRQLRFFKSYSQAKCEEECLANYTKNACNCVPFFMPSNGNLTHCRVYSIV